MTAAQFAFNWVLNNKLVTAALAGPPKEAPVTQDALEEGLELRLDYRKLSKRITIS